MVHEFSVKSSLCSQLNSVQRIMGGFVLGLSRSVFGFKS